MTWSDLEIHAAYILVEMGIMPTDQAVKEYVAKLCGAMGAELSKESKDGTEAGRSDTRH